MAQGVPFKCDTYRVLIASPSDLEEERRAATDAINDWNAQHAAAEAVVLLPVKWETPGGRRVASGRKKRSTANWLEARTSWSGCSGRSWGPTRALLNPGPSRKWISSSPAERR